jgi:hypothetical protein
MYACIILYILLLQDIVTPCSPLYSTAGIYHTFIHEYDVVYVFHVLETIFLLSRCDIIFIIHIWPLTLLCDLYFVILILFWDLYFVYDFSKFETL